MERPALPIDPLLPDVLRALGEHGSAVVTAEPGAGKTTRVPPAILEAPFLEGREVWVLQPRRLAAQMAALRVAEERGEAVGDTVGYHFRFERKRTPRTRLVYLTDGMLLPLSQGDPVLSRVGCVVLDEFHERSLALELSLGFLRRLQTTSRTDLRLLVMSATLDAQALSTYLDGAPALHSPGRVHPVTLEYDAFPREPDLERKVKSAVKRLAARPGEATVLVFLPGVGEIRRAERALQGEPFPVSMLYGDLSLEEQGAALRSDGGFKVVLSTNVAETSLTVPGVTSVVDSGWTRQMRVSPWSGLERLVTVSASQASAAQRAGRAGRVRPGACLRLYSQFEFEHRAPFDVPEILRTDLARGFLDLAALGVGDPASFPWFQAPPAEALEASKRLLGQLGFVDGAWALTGDGRRAARLPLPPRLARFLLRVEAEAKGEAGLLRSACRLAALVSEEESTSEDLLETLARYEPGREARRIEEQLASALGLSEPGRQAKKPQDDAVLARGLLAAYPDRVGKIRFSAGSEHRNKTGGNRELVLSAGGSALASDSPLTRGHDLFVVVEAQETGAPKAASGAAGARVQARARSLCAIEPEWLLDLFPDALSEEKTLEWNREALRVEGFQRLRYGQVVLDEKRLNAAELGPEAEELLLKEALSAGPQSYCDPGELQAFLNRVSFARSLEADFPVLGGVEVEAVLARLCVGCRSLKDLQDASLVEALRASLGPQASARLETLAPTKAALKKGRPLEVHYEADRPPWAESRLQDFFGMREGPKVGAGKVPVVLHLLSPAKRPVQVTSDLAGFWERHYPQVRRELGRRYPKHHWPENPLQG